MKHTTYNFLHETHILVATQNKIILDECSTVVEIDHVRNSKTAKKGKMDDIWLEFIRL